MEAANTARSAKPEFYSEEALKRSAFKELAGGCEGVIVFVHGYMDSPEMWQPLADALGLPQWKRVAVRLAPAANASSSEEALASFARQVLDTVGAVCESAEIPLVIVGHSMGGQIAELAATLLGKRVAGLVLIAPAPLGGYPLPEAMMATFKLRLAETDPAVIKAGKLALSSNLNEEGLNLLAEANLNVPTAVAIEQLLAWTGGHVQGRGRSPVDVPVVVMGAAVDKFFSPAFLEEHVVSRFARGRLAVVKNAGHWPHLEQPQAVSAHLQEFIGHL
jgi:pimeloyl-ACP methyl ester carboxylesterase